MTERLTLTQERPQDAQNGRRQGRSERRGEAYSAPYVEPLSDARTMAADFFGILLSLMRGHV